VPIRKDGSEKLIKWLIGICIFHPFLWYAINLSRPDQIVYLSSYLPRITHERAILIFVALPHIWIAAVTWTTTTFCVTIFAGYIYTVLFLTNEMRYFYWSSCLTVTVCINELKRYQIRTFDHLVYFSPTLALTCSYMEESLRSPEKLIHTYRCVQVLTNSFNEIGQPYLWIAWNDIILALTVICNFIFVKLFMEVPTSRRVAIAFDILAGATYLIVSHKTFGAFNHLTKKLIRSWMWNNQISNKAEDRQLFRKYMRSCSPLRCQLSSFGYYQKPQSIRIIGKLVYLTMKSLVVFKVAWDEEGVYQGI